MRKLILLPLLGLTVACNDPNKPDKAECDVVTGTITNTDYEFSPANWSCEADPISELFNLNSGSFNTAAGLTASDVIADYDFATDEWSGAGGDVTLTDGSTTSTGNTVDDDDTNYTWMVDGYDPDDDGSDALATTYLWDVDGEAFDCDMRFYTDRRDSTSFNWVANATVTSGEHDMTHVLVHELGHCVGLGDQTASSLTSSIMFGSYSAGNEYAGLSDDDVEAVEFLYGPA